MVYQISYSNRIFGVINKNNNLMLAVTYHKGLNFTFLCGSYAEIKDNKSKTENDYAMLKGRGYDNHIEHIDGDCANDNHVPNINLTYLSTNVFSMLHCLFNCKRFKEFEDDQEPISNLKKN